MSLSTPEHVKRLDVISAQDMLDRSLESLPACDIFIACAAVADYRPAQHQAEKIKKGEEHSTLALVRNPDIIATVASHSDNIFAVGFAAETQDVLSYARDKMERKGLDLIVANDVSEQSIGFNSDENAVTLIWREGQQSLPQASKGSIARQIIAKIAQLYPAD